ncbi:MAG TPA: conjugal transfer protein [Acidimicrobiales bacterium]
MRLIARRPTRPGPATGTGTNCNGNGSARRAHPRRRLGRDRAGNGHDPQRLIPARPQAQVAARIGLWCLVALGAIGGLVGLLRPAARPAVESAASSAEETVPPEMSGFAELAVTTWLEASGDEDDAAVESLFAANPSTAVGDSGRRRVTATYTVGARPVDDGDASGGGDEGRDYWAVTVAAAVDELGGDRRWHDAGTWYVEVGVVRDADGALVAASEPALVPAPRRPADEPRPAGGGLGVPSSDDEELATTVEGFLAALVAGDGDVSRYLSPDYEIDPVTPAPFEQITLQRWSVTELADDRVRVRLVARGTSAAGVPRTVSYELELEERAGRWEVTALSGAPTLHDDEEDDAEADDPTTTTTEPISTTTVSIAASPGA